MSLNDWLSQLKNRALPQTNTRARRRHPVRLGGIGDWLLEDRCLLSGVSPLSPPPPPPSIYVAGSTKDTIGTIYGPYTQPKPQTGPGSIMFVGNSNGFTTVPTKTITFTNDGSTNKSQQTIYPFLYSPNNNPTYDPIDPANDEYRIYVGYVQNGKDILGLPYGDSITINVPLVFWNGGRADIASDGANLIPSPPPPPSPLAPPFVPNPYNFVYTASTYIGVQGQTGGEGVIASTNGNGLLLYYKANTPGAPVNPSAAASGQLIEWTIRDQDFLTQVNNYITKTYNPPLPPASRIALIPNSQLTTLFNYDVSYVDDMQEPVAMIGNSVPVPIRYGQNQPLTVNTQGTTTTLTGNVDSALFNLLSQTFPSNKTQWNVNYNTPNGGPIINVGKVTGVTSNSITVTNTQTVTGVPQGDNVTGFLFYTSAVTQDFGWTGANNDLADMQKAMQVFTTNPSTSNNNAPNPDLGQYFGGLGWPAYYNPIPGALLKIPSGANVLINSPLTTATSPYTQGYWYLLTSGNNGQRIFYNLTEVLQNPQPPGPNPIKQGATVTFKVTGNPDQKLDLNTIQKQIMNGTNWVLSGNGIAGASNPVANIAAANIDPTNSTITVTLNQDLPNPNQGAFSLSLVAQANDPYTRQLTNLWYTWANYYVTQYNGPSSLAVSATVSADTDVKTNFRVLNFASGDQSKAAQLQVGMVVTTDGKTPLATIIKIVPTTTNSVTTYTVYLSAPLSNAGTFSFTFLKPAPLNTFNDPKLNQNLFDFSKIAGPNQKFAYAFAASVYEVMAAYSTVSLKQLQATGLPYLSMAVVYETIGGNVGFLPTAIGTDYTNISADVRDLGKSVLRGVPNFLTYPDLNTPDSQWNVGSWYPPPSATTVSGTVPYNVYNLDPFVWFVHQKLQLSGYGFSFDDDVGDINANGTSAITVTFASGVTDLPKNTQWFPSTPWGAVGLNSTVMATVTQGTLNNKATPVLTIQPTAAGVTAYWQLLADDAKNGVVGAYVTSTTAGAIPANTNLSAYGNSNALQFYLSGTVSSTNAPIQVMFFGYKPSTTLSAPAPSPPPTSSPPSSNSPGGSGSTSFASPVQALVALAVDEFLMDIDRIFALADMFLGKGSDPALENAIAAYQNAISTNPANQTLLGQEVTRLIDSEIQALLMGQAT